VQFEEEGQYAELVRVTMIHLLTLSPSIGINIADVFSLLARHNLNLHFKFQNQSGLSFKSQL